MAGSGRGDAASHADSGDPVQSSGRADGSPVHRRSGDGGGTPTRPGNERRQPAPRRAIDGSFRQSHEELDRAQSNRGERQNR
jgi:hypothetical protein